MVSASEVRTRSAERTQRPSEWPEGLPAKISGKANRPFRGTALKRVKSNWIAIIIFDDDSTGAVAAMTAETVLTFKDCTYRYGVRRPAVKAVSTQFSRGVTALLGPNGAGKSTLLALGAAALRPRSGSVSVDALGSDRPSRYRRMVSWMPQRVPVATGLSVQEHVAMVVWLKGVSRSEAWDRAGAALQHVELGGHCERRATQLSGGERSRMGLAQALAQQAPVVMLDEPTAALDPAQKEVFADLVRDLLVDRVVLISTHDVNDLAICDQVTVLASGGVTFSGSHADFLSPHGTTLTALASYRERLGAQGPAT